MQGAGLITDYPYLINSIIILVQCKTQNNLIRFTWYMANVVWNTDREYWHLSSVVGYFRGEVRVSCELFFFLYCAIEFRQCGIRYHYPKTLQNIRVCRCPSARESRSKSDVETTIKYYYNHSSLITRRIICIHII